MNALKCGVQVGIRAGVNSVLVLSGSGVSKVKDRCPNGGKLRCLGSVREGTDH